METQRPVRRRRRRRRSKLPLLLCLIALVGAGFALWLFGSGQEVQPPEAPYNPPAAGQEVPDPSQSGADEPPLPDSSSAPAIPDVSDPAPSSSGAVSSASSPSSEAPSSQPSPPESSAASPPGSSASAPQSTTAEGPYTDLYFYEADKAARYIAYGQANPALSADTVVWHVNAGIDGTPYEDYEAARYTDTQHYIVSKYRKLPDNFVPENLVDIGGYKATSDAAAAYFSMQADAKAEGYSFWAISAYRSIDSQRNLYNRYLQQDPAHIVDTYSARPGFSEHHTGRAIDLSGSNGNFLQFENSPEGPWVHQNAYKYGFILRYPKGYEHITGYDYESWHMTYVGVDIATDMHDKGIVTLEEYTVKYIDHTP